MTKANVDIVKELSDEHLRELLKVVETEIEKRDTDRFKEITNEIMELLKKFKKEFRYASAEIVIPNSHDWGTTTIDIMKYIEDIYFSK